MHYAVMATKQHYFLQLPRVDWCKLSIEITLLVGSVVVTCRSAGRPDSTVTAAYSVSLYHFMTKSTCKILNLRLVFLVQKEIIKSASSWTFL